MLARGSVTMTKDYGYDSAVNDYMSLGPLGCKARPCTESWVGSCLTCRVSQLLAMRQVTYIICWSPG